MADTLNPVQITDQWRSLNSFTTIPVGVAVSIQNTGSATVVLRISETVPGMYDEGTHIYPLETYKVATGNATIWARSYTKETYSRLQVDIAGGVTAHGQPSTLSSDSLQIQISAVESVPGVELWLLITNNTTGSIALDQLINFESFSTGVLEGTSIVSMRVIFNPDITGADQLASNSNAYVHSTSGEFIDITGTGIILTGIENLNTGLNPDVLRVTGGVVSYFTSAQTTSSVAVNEEVTFTKPYYMPPGGNIIVSFSNTALVDLGTNVLSTALLSGHFLTLTGDLELPPNNLTDGGVDNLVDNLGNNLVDA